jgi:hypothetical protein
MSYHALSFPRRLRCNVIALCGAVPSAHQLLINRTCSLVYAPRLEKLHYSIPTFSAVDVAHRTPSWQARDDAHWLKSGAIDWLHDELFIQKGFKQRQIMQEGIIRQQSV